MTAAATHVRDGFVEEALPHVDGVYRFALRLSGSPDEAEDLVQDTFLRAYRAWDQYTRGTRARSWLFAICRNVFIRRVNRSKRHDEIVRENAGRPDRSGAATPSDAPWMSGSHSDPETDFFDSIVDREVVEAVEALPEEYRSVVILSDVEGLPYAEIAEVMDLPVGTVKSRLFRGRRRLREALRDYAVEMGHVARRADAA
jgi:RNA polymerase sigma-70 factor (ECF subfamily)